MTRAKCTRSQRRGGATIELAVCLPVLMVLVFGTIESTSMIFTRQSLSIVAYETIRTAIHPSGSNAEVQATIERLLAERKLVHARVTVSPEDIESLAPGTPITVTVTAPAADNSPLPLTFFSGDLQSIATMNKE